MLLFSLLAMALLSPRTLSKPLDVNDRITTLLNNNIDTSLQEKAEAIDTILRLLSEIDLVSICEAVMMEKPNVGSSMDNIIAQAAKERAFEFMLTDKLLQHENAPFPAEPSMNTNNILPVNFPLKTSAVPMKNSAVPQDHQSHSDDGMSTRVVIDKVQSLKPNVSLSAESRRLDIQEMRRLQRPELVGFKLVPSEHYMSEMEGSMAAQTEGVDGGSQAPVQPMVEGMVNYAMVNGTEATMEPVVNDVNETTNSNSTADERTTIAPGSSTSRMSSTTTISSTNATVTSTNDISSSSDNDTTSSTNDTSSSSNDIISSVNDTTSSTNDTSSSSNDIISSVNDTTSSTNDTSSSSNDIISSVNDTMSSTTTSMSSNNETISVTNDTISSASDAILSINDTMSSNTASVPSTTAFEEEVETTTMGISSSSSTSEELFDTTTSNEIVEEALNISLSNMSTVETANDTMVNGTEATTTTPDDFTNETQILNATESSTTHLSEEVITELKNDTIDVVLANQTIPSNESSSHNETETIYEELELSSVNPTEAATVTEMYEQESVSQNDTDLTTANEETSNNETASTTAAAEQTSPPTLASLLNLTEEATPTTVANSMELSTQQSYEADTDYSPNYTDNSEEVLSTTVDYFWTPGSTIPHQNMYDYDYPSSAGQEVEPLDNTIEDSVDVRGSNAVQNDTVDVTTDSTTVTQSEYDYIYNLLGMLGDHQQLPAYNKYEDNKYDEPNNYASYDVNNLEYASDDVTDYSIDALKTSTKFLTDDHYNNDVNKKQGINMLASVDSPANTAEENDFMLSAQPGYYNSLADQTSWKLKDNQHKENSVSNDKDYDKRFTAHSQDSKNDVTSAIASSIGVQQKTVWSEPTLPQMLYHSNGYSCPGLFGYYADIADCQAFFICSWGMPYRFLCPPGTLWNTAESVCDWANNVACNRKK